MPRIPALGRLRHKDDQLEASLGYKDPVSKKQKQTNKKELTTELTGI
jgi:hypothetical protein